MGNIQHVSKWGSSLAARIPKAIAEQWNIVEGASVQLEVYSGRLLVRRQTHGLAVMVDQITSDNIHHNRILAHHLTRDFGNCAIHTRYLAYGVAPVFPARSVGVGSKHLQQRTGLGVFCPTTSRIKGCAFMRP